MKHGLLENHHLVMIPAISLHLVRGFSSFPRLIPVGTACSQLDPRLPHEESVPRVGVEEPEPRRARRIFYPSEHLRNLLLYIYIHMYIMCIYTHIHIHNVYLYIYIHLYIYCMYIMCVNNMYIHIHIVYIYNYNTILNIYT
jgi:hypothetical protein